MIKAHFYDLLRDIAVEPFEEINRLNFLFSKENALKDEYGRACTLENFIDKNAFKDLKFRATFTNISEMRAAFELSEYQFSDTFDCLFLFAEFLLAVFLGSDIAIENNELASTQATIIIHNINVILDKTNHKTYERPNGEIIIIEKNELTTEAVEIIDDRDITIQTIEYNHHALKGDLQKKRAILMALGNYIEPIFNSKKLINNGYSNMQSDIGFVLNNFNIRHNNLEGKNAKDYVKRLSKEKLENWYDKAYNMILTAIITAENIDISNELSQLKIDYKW